MILNKAQAEAVYSAICALNDVATHEFIAKLDSVVGVSATNSMVHIKRANPVPFEGSEHEHYDSQAAFAAAYNLS